MTTPKEDNETTRQGVGDTRDKQVARSGSVVSPSARPDVKDPSTDPNRGEAPRPTDKDHGNLRETVEERAERDRENQERAADGMEPIDVEKAVGAAGSATNPAPAPDYILNPVLSEASSDIRDTFPQNDDPSLMQRSGGMVTNPVDFPPGTTPDTAPDQPPVGSQEAVEDSVRAGQKTPMDSDSSVTNKQR